MMMGLKHTVLALDMEQRRLLGTYSPENYTSKT